MILIEYVIIGAVAYRGIAPRPIFICDQTRWIIVEYTLYQTTTTALIHPSCLSLVAEVAARPLPQIARHTLESLTDTLYLLVQDLLVANCHPSRPANRHPSRPNIELLQYLITILQVLPSKRGNMIVNNPPVLAERTFTKNEDRN